MKYTCFALGLLLILSCTKTDNTTASSQTATPQEDAIKFYTNLDTGKYSVIDTLPLVINISSKMPTAGVVYSVVINWTDSSKEIYKLDSTSTNNFLNLNIPGFKKSGNYTATIKVTSKSKSTNSDTKTLSINKPIYFLKSFNYDIDLSGYDFGQNGLAGQIDQTVSQTILYATANGTEHIITNPAYMKATPPLHFVLKNNIWTYENKYDEGLMDGFRNYDPVDKNGTYVIANHGVKISWLQRGHKKLLSCAVIFFKQCTAWQLWLYNMTTLTAQKLFEVV